MSDKQEKKIQNFQLRARMPLIIRVAAVFALAATIIAIGIGFYRSRNNQEFRMKGYPTELSKDVVAQVNGYERRETDGDVVKYYIKADKATTFTDNHQELENVFLQVFGETGETSDQIKAQKAVYIPAENKNFTAYFAGDVNVETRDGLKVKTEQLTYNKETEIANADELIEFSRENVTGKSFGAIVKTKEKTLELLRDVEIIANGQGTGEFANSNFQQARIAARHAFLNQADGKIDFNQSVNINITPNESDASSQPTDIKSDRATAFFVNKEIKKIDLNGNVDVYQKPTSANAKWTKTRANRAVANINKELKQLELFENVFIETASNGAKPTQIKTNYAIYEKDSDKFELKNGVEIVTAQDNKQTIIKSSEAIYEQANGKVFLYGAAEITQGVDFLKGDNVTAELFPNKKLKNAFVKGNAYLKQTAPERTTEISGDELNAFWGDNQQLQIANALGASNAVLIPAKSDEYTKVTLSAPNAIKLNFNGAGLLEQMQTEGRTTVAMTAPTGKIDASNKRLTADTVKTLLNANGKDLAKAEAVGNAELFVEPLRNSAENYRTTVNAPRFDCDFFETGNSAKNCSATGKAKAVRVPTITGENRGNQTLISDRMNASFNQQSQDIQQFDAVGNAKFSELDRNGTANQITFTASDETVRLRGEPLVSDSRARAKANEIDWDTRNEKSFLRGKVSTTYISQKQTGGATPFAESNSPVFITSDAAEFQHQAETGIYTGNARAWQENNYVRADRLVLQQKQGQLYGEGAVQSLLYDAKRKENGKESNVPVYAQSQKIYYFKDKNLLRYETDVDIRQGTDRIVAGVANVYLTDKNEVAQTVAERDVVVTSPNRKAVGDYAQYVAADESIVLRGNPARIDDSESGSTQGAQVTVFLKTNRVINESKTNQTNTGRIRTVYKVKKQ
ncbi:MAG: LPS export ABC transporter periplasmic protein LptC [Acidobacteria bacterium]|jgi:LPS export ABC transporter protein LptC|nr:LPS export ABC transporter periplasmic protein LptC [Acidobacteriota bacterium]